MFYWEVKENADLKSLSKLNQQCLLMIQYTVSDFNFFPGVFQAPFL
jgi:hypothetical protein